jgi:trk system potassium uptake protein TrkA
MRVLIAGGGRTASHLATVLLRAGHDVRVIEGRPEVLVQLHREMPTEVVYEGEPLDMKVFEQTGPSEAKVLAACTPSDSDNLMLCYMAREHYGVPRTIAVINNPRSAWLFGRMFGVDVALNQAEVLASLIEEEMSLGDMMVLTKLHRGKFSLVEEKIPAGAAIVGKSIRDANLPPDSVIAAIIRHGTMVIPRGDLTFEVGDEVLAVVDPPAAEALARMFSAELAPSEEDTLQPPSRD